MANKSFKFSTLALMTTLLAACGGGGGGDTNGGGSVFTPKTITGAAVDFYLANAKVTFEKEACQTLNPNVRTDQNGKFTFKTSQECQETGLSITEGIDTITQVPFEGVLKVKSTNYQQKANPNIVASPLTTLQAELPATAFATLLKNLGFSLAEDVTDFDPITEGSNSQLASVVILQQLLTQLVQAGLSLSDAVLLIEKSAQQNPLTSTNSTISTNFITTLFKEAATYPSVDKNKLDASSTKIIATANLLIEGLKNPGGLIEYLTQHPDILAEIQENTAVAVYKNLRVFDFEVSDIQDSTTRKTINKTAVDSLASLQFSLPTDINGTDTIKLGFKTKAQIGTQPTETLDAYISAIQVTFSAGQISKVVLPKGAIIELRSSLTDFPTASFEVDTEKTLSTTNNKILLKNIVDAYPNLLKSPYDKYLNIIQTTGANGVNVDITASVLASKFPISSALRLPTSEFSMNANPPISFSGPTATGYFTIK